MARIGPMITISACALAALAAAPPVLAQDAAETATILSGTSRDTGRVSRDMGNSVRGSINGAADAISGTPQRRVSAGNLRRANQPDPRTSGLYVAVGDALDRTDAPECQLGNGSTIRVSGNFQPSTQTQCADTRDAPEED